MDGKDSSRTRSAPPSPVAVRARAVTRVAMAERPRPPVQVFAYDDALGREEGTELEALLAYFPASAPESAKVRALSLARGIVGFVSQFDDDGTEAGRRDANDAREDARVVRTKRGRLACLLAEEEEEEETRPTMGTIAGRSPAHASPRRLWLCVSVDESVASVAAVRDGALVDLLRIFRDDYAMLRGGHPPRGQPREGAPDDASGGCDDRRSARLLAVLVADLGARVSPAAAGWEGATLAPDAMALCGDALRALHSPLSPEPGCPLTPASREAFLLTQSAVNAAQLSLEDWADAHRRDADVDADGKDVDDDDGDLVADTAVFHEGGMLWSSSTATATRALARYAARCLIPSSAFREEGADDEDQSMPPEKASAAGRARALAAAVRAEAAAGMASLAIVPGSDFGFDDDDVPSPRPSGPSPPTGSCDGPAPRERRSRRADGTFPPRRTSCDSALPRRVIGASHRV